MSKLKKSTAKQAFLVPIYTTKTVSFFLLFYSEAEGADGYRNSRRGKDKQVLEL